MAKTRIKQTISPENLQRLEDYSSITGKPANIDSILEFWLDTVGAGQIDYSVDPRPMHEFSPEGTHAHDCAACIHNAKPSFIN